jgi:hypothetical protein
MEGWKDAGQGDRRLRRGPQLRNPERPAGLFGMAILKSAEIATEGEKMARIVKRLIAVGALVEEPISLMVGWHGSERIF